MKVGLFGIGLEAYWPQFDGLKARLEGYVEVVAAKLARPGVEIVNLGLIDTPAKALDAGHAFRTADVDLTFLYGTTYALSSTVLPVVRRAGVPVVILNLQPERAIDYAAFNQLRDRTRMTGEWLAYCAACPVPEIANVFTRAGIPTHQVTGVLEGDAHVDGEIEDWIEAARVAHVMAHNRLGVMGHYYNGMLDIYSDLTAQSAGFRNRHRVHGNGRAGAHPPRARPLGNRGHAVDHQGRVRYQAGLRRGRAAPRRSHGRRAGRAGQAAWSWLDGLFLRLGARPRARGHHFVGHSGVLAADRGRCPGCRRV